ncbi:MAG: pyrimidine-nucleoside phosphorylase, partial [Clostridiales bacterium]|nr:pyrimidine-nucleoside phosphorylase [Clostridiales bacterium]
IDDPSLLPQASHHREVLASRAGYITAMDAEQIGIASLILGAGRETKEDEIDYGAGVVLEKKVGDAVTAGGCIAILHTNRETALDPAEEILANAYQIGAAAPEPQPLIYEVIQ